MEDSSDGIQVAGFVFFANFDSGNLGKVEQVPKVTVPNVPSAVKKVSPAANPRTPVKSAKPVAPVELPDFEFNIWTRPDCCGTQYENSNRTWFYFGVRGGPPFSLVKLNIVDLNKQGRMYRDGMAPVFRINSNRPWERVRDKPVYTMENNVFILSFKYRTLESPKSVTYFAFTYPYSYSDLQSHLTLTDARMRNPESLAVKTDTRFTKGLKLATYPEDKIYYHRETVCYSIEGRRVDLITISSHHNITGKQEPRLPHLFPDDSVPRCLGFQGKKVIFISARVHPGETPSSFVLNGFMNFLISRDDPVALLLRRQFVFKLVPMLNPDGVARGHYRTDTRGANLNRFYLKPDVRLHPAIYAARSLIRYYHYGEEVPDNVDETDADRTSISDGSSSPELTSSMETLPIQDLSLNSSNPSLSSETGLMDHTESKPPSERKISVDSSSVTSGLFLYMDMHGHASKKGIFMYGNHFERIEDSVECMLLPKLMSYNSQNFHFGACNFTERNMYLRDKRDGASREGSGRVAVLRLTGLTRSYTLECNYNTGRYVNTLPLCSRELPGHPYQGVLSPPKYTPLVYEEVGRAIGVSILDVINANPWSRVPNCEHHTVNGVRDWLRQKILADKMLFPRDRDLLPRAKRNSQVFISVRPPRPPAKPTSGARLNPIPGKSLDTEWGNKEMSGIAKRAGKTRPAAVRNICGKGRAVEKSAVAKPIEEQELEKKIAINTVSLNCNAAGGEPSTFKQSPKRLKMCKNDGDIRSKKPDWNKDAASDGTPDLTVFAKSSRGAGTSSDTPGLSPTNKKRPLKPKTQLSPIKHKKSLEKRRNSDKKSKILYKKASKLALSATDLAKSDRKRRNAIN